MPKLLSRSKHEEFESNLAFQIRNQEERIAENRGNWSTCEIGSCEHCASCALFLQQPVLLYFTSQFFCYIFLFLPILTLVIAFVLVFLVISYTLSTDISLSLYKLNFTSLRQYSEREAVSPLFHFLPFSLIFSPFLGCQTPSKDDNLEDERLKPLPP